MGKKSILVQAVKEANLNAVKALLQKDHSPNIVDKAGTPVLTLASMRGDVEILNALLGAGAELDAFDKEKKTALYRAAGQGRLTAVNTLLEAGAAVDKANKQTNATPLLIAVSQGHLDVVTRLCQAGANTAIKSYWGSPREMALKNNRQDIVAVLDNPPRANTNQTSNIQAPKPSYQSPSYPMSSEDVSVGSSGRPQRQEMVPIQATSAPKASNAQMQKSFQAPPPTNPDAKGTNSPMPPKKAATALTSKPAFFPQVSLNDAVNDIVSRRVAHSELCDDRMQFLFDNNSVKLPDFFDRLESLWNLISDYDQFAKELDVLLLKCNNSNTKEYTRIMYQKGSVYEIMGCKTSNVLRSTCVNPSLEAGRIQMEILAPATHIWNTNCLVALCFALTILPALICCFHSCCKADPRSRVQRAQFAFGQRNFEAQYKLFEKALPCYEKAAESAKASGSSFLAEIYYDTAGVMMRINGGKYYTAAVMLVQKAIELAPNNDTYRKYLLDLQISHEEDVAYRNRSVTHVTNVTYTTQYGY